MSRVKHWVGLSLWLLAACAWGQSRGVYPVTPTPDAGPMTRIAVLYAPVGSAPRDYEIAIPIPRIERYQDCAVSNLAPPKGEPPRTYHLERLPKKCTDTHEVFHLVPLQPPRPGEEITFRLWQPKEVNPEKFSLLKVVFQQDIKDSQRLELLRGAVAYLEPGRAADEKRKHLVHMVLDENGQRYGFVPGDGLAVGMRFEPSPIPADTLAELDETDRMMVHVIVPASQANYLRVCFNSEAAPPIYRIFPAEASTAVTNVKDTLNTFKALALASPEQQGATASPIVTDVLPDPYVHLAFQGGPFTAAGSFEAKGFAHQVEVFLPTLKANKTGFETTKTAIEGSNLAKANSVKIPLLVQERIRLSIKLGLFHSHLRERSFAAVDGRVRELSNRPLDYALLIVPHIWNFEGNAIRKVPMGLQRLEPLVGLGFDGFPNNVFLGVLGRIAQGFDVAVGIQSRRTAVLPPGVAVGDLAPSGFSAGAKRDTGVFFGVTIPLTVFSTFLTDITEAKK